MCAFIVCLGHQNILIPTCGTRRNAPSTRLPLKKSTDVLIPAYLLFQMESFCFGGTLTTSNNLLPKLVLKPWCPSILQQHPIPAYRVLHGRKRWLMVLIGCCMHWHRLGGTKAAMGRPRPPWLRSASGGSFCQCFVCVLRGRHHRHGRKQAYK